VKKIRILLLAALLIAVLIPMTVSAAGVFYCSAYKNSGGAGTYANPWACSTDAQTNDLINRICLDYYGGHLYRLYSNYYIYYRIEWGGTTQRCTVTRTEYPGYPPNTGVDMPLPLLLGGGAALGILLVGAGLVLRRNKALS
jgi:LPXTG-motif cell wall-anchored protein